MKDDLTKAFDEWYKDAMRDVARMPNRWEAFKSGWEAAEEFYGCERKELTEMELRAQRGCSDSPGI